MNLVGRVWRTLRATLMVAALSFVAAGCNRGARSPEEAFANLAQAVRDKDPARLYDALDQETQWSWMTTRRSQRESFDIMLSNFPEAERTRQSRRFEAGANSEDERSFFARSFAPERWAELARGLPTAPNIKVEAARALVDTTDGRILEFKKGSKSGRWGFAGLSAEAEQMKRRAIADLELIRNSAADYERAATRAGK